jgi:hypothetical protein
MKQNHWKTLLSSAGVALICAAAWLGAPATSAAFTTKGEDKSGQNCELIGSSGSSTFGKCENVCSGKEVTRDAINNRWVCRARMRPSDTVRPPKSGGVFNQAPRPTATPVRPGGKTGKVQPN